MTALWRPEDVLALRKRLADVLWIGGATDAGKTTTAALLGEKYGLYVYHNDKHWRENWAKITPETQPAMHRWQNMTMDERWVNRTVDDLTDHTLQIARERLPLIIDDIQNMPQEKPIIVEGFGLMPDFIAPLLTDKNQAVWLLPSPAFKQASVERRGKATFHDDTSNPALAWRNHLQLDLKLGEVVQNQAARHRLHTLINNGVHTPDHILRLLEIQFADSLNH